MPPSGEVSVPAKDGLIVQISLNGKGPFEAVFDTGSVNIISAALAGQLGLKVDASPIEFGTSSPDSIQVHTTHIGTLQIGDLLVRDQTFYVIDMPPDLGAPELAVGWELLQSLAVRIDFEHQRLTFYDGASFHYAGRGTAVPVRYAGNLILVPASIAGASGWFELDSGNEFGTMINTRFTVKNDLVRAVGARFLAYNGRGFAGPSPKAYLGRVTTMRIGDITVPSVIARFSTDPADKRDLDGNIGQDVLRHFTEIFDCPHNRVFFEQTDASAKPEVFNRAGLVLDTSGRGLEVMTVLPGSPAEQAGIEAGDLITEVDGKSPSDEINQPAFLRPPGTQVRLSLKHGARIREVTVTLRDVL